MSLLLDALKSSDSNDAAAAEPEEEVLDAQATLKLLSSTPPAQSSSTLPAQSSSTPPAQSALALVSTSDSDSDAAPSRDFAPELAAEVAPVAPSSERAQSSVAGPRAQLPPTVTVAATATAPAAAAAAKARVTVAARPATPRIKTYGLLLTALAGLAGIAMVGKSLWPFGSNAVTYPGRRVPQQSPVSTTDAPAPSAGAVQVSSTRPADQFAYAGNAPEIDLGDAVIHHPAATSRSAVSAAAHRTATTLSVTRAEGPSSIDRHVEAGYRALAAGNVATAQNEYLAALELDPNNVDALLGTATAAGRDGMANAAAAAYAKVLELEPGNPDATAAMTMLRSDGSAVETKESRLKILIAGDDGGRPALHAALGGVYAADARWSEAAQEYFTALNKDPGNPDLAFNVAASLDQNRNSAMALNYYRQALVFARQRPAQIDPHAIEQRIGQLQARVEMHASGTPETP